MEIENSSIILIIEFFQSRNLIIIVAAAGRQYAHLFVHSASTGDTEETRHISKHRLFAGLQLAFGLVLGPFSSDISRLALFQAPGRPKVMALALAEPELQA